MILQAIRSILLDAVDTTIYSSNQIRFGFSAPVGKNFISYVVLGTNNLTSLGALTYSKDELDETITGNLLIEHMVQVDIYSDNTAEDYFNSSVTSFNLMNYLYNFAPNFLLDNYPDFSVNTINDIENLSELGDNGKYLMRNMIRFTVLEQSKVTKPQSYFNQVDVDNYFTDVKES